MNYVYKIYKRENWHLTSNLFSVSARVCVLTLFKVCCEMCQLVVENKVRSNWMNRIVSDGMTIKSQRNRNFIKFEWKILMRIEFTPFDMLVNIQAIIDEMCILQRTREQLIFFCYTNKAKGKKTLFKSGFNNSALSNPCVFFFFHCQIKIQIHSVCMAQNNGKMKKGILSKNELDITLFVLLANVLILWCTLHSFNGPFFVLGFP